MANPILKCWLCGSEEYHVFLHEDNQDLVTKIKCCKCSEPLYLSARLEKKHECANCEFFDEIKPRRAYCCATDSFKNEDDYCTQFSAKSDNASEKTEIQNESDRSILGGGSDSSE